ncbi:phosphatidate cytidylyltransferase [Desulfopila sp. IMCC35008]|uniref:phosphatidate cytidylyltransferase n=1 Tax=Desulfopila sp. IMCC35008 TaxID=2653858 RepID=UPI0013D39873|nr:phosphatidate cytidylyltransferase [Desulfopila sp. IMCC35008]
MKRTLPGIGLALAWVVLLLVGTPLLFHFVMIGVAAVCGYEYTRMALGEEITAMSRLYLAGTLVFPILFSGVLITGPGVIDGLFISFFLISSYFLCRYTQFEDSYDKLCRLGFGVVYIGVLASYLVQLRYLPDGGAWLVVLSSVTAGSDTGAYMFGTAFGRNKLCPGISPNKSIEGAIGGLASGVAAAFLFAWLLFDHVNWLFVAVAAIVLTVVGIMGDLTESIIKRGTGTKDSGIILAGHGGALDRIDSMLLAAPFFYYMLLVMGSV